MDDKKRLIGEEVPAIKQGEIDAWNRGKGDALAGKLLKVSQKLTPKRAISLVKMYAELGDIHYLSTRFDVTTDEVKRVLAAFTINSIEDAKNLVNNGVIGELAKEQEKNRADAEASQRTSDAEAQARLTEQQEEMKPEVKTPDVIDQEVAVQRDEAQRKNKEDQLRQVIADGLDPNTNSGKFRIPLARVRDFQKMIPYGVSQLQRQFGGSAKDIVSEIERLAPQYQRDMLRP